VLAVVTGVTSGIGASLCDKLIAREWRVVGIARSEEKLEAARACWGDGFEPVRCDLADPAERARAIATVRELHPRIDVLVNNAGETAYELPTELSLERWRALFEVNLMAGIDLSRALSSAMPPGSLLLNVSSVTARFFPNPKFAPYAVTKAALETLTEGLRLELDPRGVRVSLVVPGLVDTPIYGKAQNFEKTMAKIRDQIPRWLSAEEVADAMVWIIERPPHMVVSELTLMPRGQTR
jgi:NAD(P)-dependent dehydrogenase (short-subunit alcohol dehydrogenase family)